MTDFNSLSTAEQESFLKAVELPVKTKTYQPVSHEEVINDTEKMLTTAGRDILGKIYTIADQGQIMSATWRLAPVNPGDKMEDILSMQNSYNKRVTLKYAYGIYDPDTETRLISGEVHFKRKHTGKVKDEFAEVLTKSIEFLSDHRENMLKDIEMLKYIVIDKRLAAELNGRLFFNEQVIKTPHMTELKGRFNARSTVMFDDDNKTTLWKYYTFLAEAIKDLHASLQIDNHITIYNFLKINFGFL